MGLGCIDRCRPLTTSLITLAPWLAKNSVTISGLPAPGHTMLQRMLCLPYSRATTLVSPRNANFDAVYAPVAGHHCRIGRAMQLDPRQIRSSTVQSWNSGTTHASHLEHKLEHGWCRGQGCRCRWLRCSRHVERPQRARTSSTARPSRTRRAVAVTVRGTLPATDRR